MASKQANRHVIQYLLDKGLNRFQQDYKGKFTLFIYILYTFLITKTIENVR